ncbi:MAG: hypothetical protein HQ581_24365 [Planctomycetes bacterium]|nr:hypothetical protein [Planctomycetota bacterium]
MSDPLLIPDNGPSSRDGRPATLPSWLLSMIVHAAGLLILAMTVGPSPPSGAAGERTGEVGIVLKRHQGKRNLYTGEKAQDKAESAAAASAAQSAGPSSLAALLGDPVPVDAGPALPSRQAIGRGPRPGGGVVGVDNATEGTGGNRGTPDGPGVATGVFGTKASGSKFVYVFDRSGSMEGSGRSPLAAVKAHLLASLNDLETVHQFHIIFYNENPLPFRPGGRDGSLIFATEQNKKLAHQFIRGVRAAGGTKHEAALEMAMALHPDVIFFLTDAGDPLSSDQLAKIRKRANGIVIVAIEFGYGPQQNQNSFLRRLADQNGGQYAYVNVKEL